MPQVTRLYLLRHGPTTAPPGCLVGASDIPLSGQGLTRLHPLFPQLHDLDLWYCSPLLRTRQTLEYMQAQGCVMQTVAFDERLREIHFGAWEMQTFTSIAAAYPEEIELWSKAYRSFVFPQGEAVADFVQRVQELLTTLVHTEFRSIGLMTHGGVIRTLLCLALGLPVEHYLLFDVQPAALTLIELFEQGGVLKGFNL